MKWTALLLIPCLALADSSDITPEEMAQIRQRIQEKQRLEAEGMAQYREKRQLELRLRMMQDQIDQQKRDYEVDRQIDNLQRIQEHRPLRY